MNTENDDGLLSRWERRKQAVQDAEAAEVEAAEQFVHAEKQAELEEKTDEEILEELGLPDPDTLKEGDDFKAFMQTAVPARLRNRALRKLWLSNPALANLDMLVDYGEDYTDAATVIEGMQTAYEVGKGMLRKVEEVAEKLGVEEGESEAELAAQEPESELDQPDSLAEGPVEEVSVKAESPGSDIETSATDASMEDSAEPIEMPNIPRRMAFSFSD